MSKIAIISDTHWGVRNDSPAFLDSTRRFLNEVFFPYLISSGIRIVVHLGDLLDRRKYCSVYTVSRLRSDFIRPLVEMGVEYHQILGNHDTSFKNTNSISSVTELYHAYPISIYEDPTEVVLHGESFLLIPWITPENRAATMGLIESARAPVCFGHLALSGFEMHRGSVMESGMDSRLLDRFDVVLSGHYHHRSTDGHVFYVGAHGEFTWSDYDDPRGFNIYDTETRSLEFIQNPFKMFKKLWYDDRETIDVSKIDFQSCASAAVKVVVREKNNVYMFDRFMDELERVSPYDIQVVEDHANMDRYGDDSIDEAESTMDIFKKHIAKAEGVDRVKLECKISELYQEALTRE